MRLQRLKGRLDSAVRSERGVYLSPREVKELTEWVDSMLWTGTVGPCTPSVGEEKTTEKVT